MNQCFAFCNEAIAIASDSTVSLYSPKTLRKFRVESFTDFRVIGLHFTVDATHTPSLHIVDCTGNYTVVDVRTLTAVQSHKLPLSLAAAAGRKKIVTAKNKAASEGTTVTHALFYQDAMHDGELHIIIGTSQLLIDFTASDIKQPKVRGETPFLLEECLVAVSGQTGHLLITQRGKRWVTFFDATGSKGKTVQLSIDVESIVCHPLTCGFAVGGQRGELHIFQDAKDVHHFEDHWHHTALASLTFSADGHSLFTGAAEGTLLVWNLHSYTYKKIGVHLGPIRSLLLNTADSSRLLVPCAESTLAIVDLLQHRLVRSIDGISWSSSRRCSGLVATRWMGQSVVALKGHQNSVRLCDANTQEALHTITLSTQMETVANPPECGIKQIGFLDDSRIAVTYEEFTGSSLPSILRFWSYDGTSKKHCELQSVYNPHDSAVIGLVMDAANRRVFTLSKNSMKVWTETAATANDATNVSGSMLSTRWVNVSSMKTPSSDVTSMALTGDGSVLLVADDAVHCFDVTTTRTGARWPAVAHLTQTASAEGLQDLQVDLVNNVVCARDSHNVFVWTLNPQKCESRVFHSESTVVASVLRVSKGDMVVATSDGRLQTLDLTTMKVTASDTPSPTNIECLSLVDDNTIAVVDSVRGFCVVRVPGSTVASWSNEGLQQPPAATTSQLSTFFRSETPTDNQTTDDAVSSGLASKVGRLWLNEVLGNSPYTAPSPSTVLHAYIQSVNEPFKQSKW